MLDYINWYLVELKRDLGIFARKEDVILEARAHLEERAAELAAKGFDSETAAKQAIVEFGDPREIAWAEKGGGVSRRAWWTWSFVIALLLSSIWIPSIMLMSGRYWFLTPVAFLAGPTIALGLIVWLSIRGRTVIAVPALALAVIIYLAIGMGLASAAGPVSVPGQYSVVLFSSINDQVAKREAWIQAADSQLPRIAEAKDRITKGDLSGFKLVRGARVSASPYSAPRAWRESRRNLPLPLEGSPMIRLGPSTFGHYSLDYFYSPEEGKLAWEQEGSNYISFVKAHKDEMRMEIGALRDAESVPYHKRFAYLCMGMFSTLGIFGAITCSISGAIVLSGLVSRRLRWRRRRILA